MCTRIVLAILVLLLTPGLLSLTPVFGAAKKLSPAASILAAESLRGSMQGQAAIALDLNGEGSEDLVVGAPYSQQKGATGALLVYLAGPGGFPKNPSAVLNGDGNLGWSLVSLGKNYFAAGAFSGSGEKASLAGTVTIYNASRKPQAVKVLEGEQALDKFGYALAAGDLNGDGHPDLIVGAPFNSPTPERYQQGAVYVFFGPNYSPSQALKIPASSAASAIGFSLATGDINGDGIDDLLIQASGKVVCYYGSATFAPVPASPDVVFKSADAGFGKAITVLWDLDGDGCRDVAVGADQATLNNVIDCGRLFILRGGTGSRTVNADTVSPDRLARIDGEVNGGRFGSAILPLGDVNGDSVPDLAVSAVHADAPPWKVTGKIFVFSGTSLTAGTGLSSARSFPGEARDMHLGASLALVAGGRQLAAGAPTEDSNTGKVRLFELR